MISERLTVNIEIDVEIFSTRKEFKKIKYIEKSSKNLAS